MSKKSNQQLPPGVSIDNRDEPTQVEVVETHSRTIAGATITITAPILTDITGYSARRLDVRCTGREAEGWKALAFGLSSSGVQLRDGKFVRSTTDAVRWVGEQLAKNLS